MSNFACDDVTRKVSLGGPRDTGEGSLGEKNSLLLSQYKKKSAVNRD